MFKKKATTTKKKRGAKKYAVEKTGDLQKTFEDETPRTEATTTTKRNQALAKRLRFVIA